MGTLDETKKAEENSFSCFHFELVLMTREEQCNAANIGGEVGGNVESDSSGGTSHDRIVISSGWMDGESIRKMRMHTH